MTQIAYLVNIEFVHEGVETREDGIHGTDDIHCILHRGRVEADQFTEHYRNGVERLKQGSFSFLCTMGYLLQVLTRISP